mgnify:CR=1 FL=1
MAAAQIGNAVVAIVTEEVTTGASVAFVITGSCEEESFPRLVLSPQQHGALTRDSVRCEISPHPEWHCPICALAQHVVRALAGTTSKTMVNTAATTLKARCMIELRAGASARPASVVGFSLLGRRLTLPSPQRFGGGCQTVTHVVARRVPTARLEHFGKFREKKDLCSGPRGTGARWRRSWRISGTPGRIRDTDANPWQGLRDSGLNWGAFFGSDVAMSNSSRSPKHNLAESMSARIGSVDTSKKRRLRVAILVCAIAVVSLLHYLTPTTYVWLHPLLQRAYYIPILLMALWFSWRGGIVAATIAGVFYLPHIVMAWQSNPEYRSAQFVEIGMFFVIATLTGVLADVERKQRQKIEETAAKLSETYAQLQASVEQLRRADRLSALGELSAGLAHEIRNPLGALEGAVQILHRPELSAETRQEFAEMARKEVERLKVLLTNFLDFARPRPPQRAVMEPRLLLDSVSRLAVETARMANVHISVEAGEAPSIAVDTEQIKQVLLNLVLNAIQAMPQGGQVALRARQEDASVLLEVADQGSGIPSENLERIFDPFFTTRANGTGLGLSIAHQIVHGHGGQIAVRNNPDRGVTFTLILPLATSEPDASPVVNVRV